MKNGKLLGSITSVLLCVLIPLTVFGENSARQIEENGVILKTVWENEAGETVPGPEGYAFIQYTYKANNTYEAYYDAEGAPCRNLSGCYGRRVTKDGKGNIIEIEYLDENGDRMLNNRGYGMVVTSYFGFGAVRTVSYYGLGNRQIIVPTLGYASIAYEYSNKTMTAKTYRDERGNPVDAADGYAVLKQKLNKRFQVLSIRYDHADGTPATGPDGWFRCVKDLDDKGRLISVKYYDTGMQMTDRGVGYAWEGYEWADDNTVMVTRYDMRDEPVADKAGVVSTLREMQDDRIMKESFLDKDGNHISNSQGVGAIAYSYDDQGLASIKYYDLAGNPVMTE